MKRILLLLVSVAGGCVAPAFAADAFAKKDVNQVPAATGVSETNGEIRRVLTDNSGYQVFRTTGTVTLAPGATVGQGSAGAAEWPVKTSSTTSGVAAYIQGQPDVSDRVARKIGQAFLRNPGDTANMGDVTTPIRTDPVGISTQPTSDAAGQAILSGIKTGTDRIPAQGPAAKAASLPVTFATDQPALANDATGYFNLSFATASVTNAGVVCLFPSNATRVTHLISNECDDDVRAGNASITATVGQIIKSGSTISLDVPRFYRGPICLTGTVATACKVSATEGTP